MESIEIKIRVSQNCHCYKIKHSMELINNITYRSESCNSCVNYIKEKCREGLFDEIREIISMNWQDLKLLGGLILCQT